MVVPDYYINAFKELLNKSNLSWTRRSDESVQLCSSNKQLSLRKLDSDNICVEFSGNDFSDSFSVDQYNDAYKPLNDLFLVANGTSVRVIKLINEFLKQFDE